MKQQQKKCKHLLGPVATQFSNAQTGEWRIVKPIILKENCKMCKQCLIYCPVDAISQNLNKTALDIDYEFCKGCGICANVCVVKCINMVRNED